MDKDSSIITCYIDKISTPVLDDIFKRGRHFDIYIPRLSVCGLHLLTILTKYQANISPLTNKCEHPLTLTTVRSHATIMKT